MTLSNFGRSLLARVMLALLGGCVVSQPFVGSRVSTGARSGVPLVSALRQSEHRSDYRITYNFQGSPDGANPVAGLLSSHGMLYGTTRSAGAYGYGAVYSASPSGDERVLYSFRGRPDGWGPLGALVEIGGTFYGTTSGGGFAAHNCTFLGCGTVFTVGASGKEHVLYRFKGRSDGANPNAGLTILNGVLYGTTVGGGSSHCKEGSSGYRGCGVVFEVTTTGAERVLHRFQGGSSDGSAPLAPLLAIGDKLYGTASEGGSSNAGIVYEVGRNGKERVLYSFRGAPDGSYPTAGLIAVDRLFFGTTSNGGTSCAPSGGCGTLFEMRESGDDEHVIYSFGGNDGIYPTGDLVELNGRFYGTTAIGGGIYEMSLSGKIRVLHNFGKAPDGHAPQGGLTLLNGRFYGPTSGGGKYGGSSGDGTIFRITP